jgi:hypothetical protein
VDGISAKVPYADLYEIPITRLSPSSRIHTTKPPRFRERQRARSTAMMDIVMLAIAAAFFAVSIGYVYACDRM